jgi:PPOX class probable F420-dependent enzyme
MPGVGIYVICQVVRAAKCPRLSGSSTTTIVTMAREQTPPQRIDHFLRTEEVIWLSTVGEDGMPGIVPIWFSWDGRAVRLLSKPGARKIDNIRVNNRVMLALGNEEDDFDVGLIEARAELPDVPADTFMPDSHWTKYARDLAGIGLGRREYVATYSQPVLIRPTRFLPWHGRTEPDRPPRPRQLAVCRVGA